MRKFFRSWGATAVLVVALFPHQIFAQQAPDAGTLLREQPKPPAQPVAPK